MILMKVPYPMGYYAKGLDGPASTIPNRRLDRGRGLWSARRRRTPWLNESARARTDGRAHPGATRSAGALGGRGT